MPGGTHALVELREKAKAEGARPQPSPSVPDALRDYRVASSIYDGMVEPLIPFALRGAVWYQGESNEARAQQYELLLPTMIRAWRERWGQGDFHFGIIQLPNYRRVLAEPADEAWSHIREAQRALLCRAVNAARHVRIERVDGTRMGFGRALLRHFVGYPLSFALLGLGFLIAAVSVHGRGLHDMIAGTIVVREGSI